MRQSLCFSVRVHLKATILVDEMMFIALPTVLVTSWGMHLSMQFLSWRGIIFFPENLDDYEIPLHVINISQESV